MTYNMKNLYNDFSSTDAVQFVSITVDPENDSNEIWIESYIDGSLDIYMSNLEAVAGIQFRLINRSR